MQKNFSIFVHTNILTHLDFVIIQKEKIVFGSHSNNLDVFNVLLE